MNKQLLFLAMSMLLSVIYMQGQDYIITWQNDTIACNLPGDAKKAGLKPFWKYENGYRQIAIFFDNDSIRVIKAGEIKGYTRKKHGRRLLCDGDFEAKQVVLQTKAKRTFVEDNSSTEKTHPWFFFNRVIVGKFANLYIKYESDGSCYYLSYYIHRHGIDSVNTVVPIITKKKMLVFLSDSDIATEMQRFKYKKSSKGFSEIVKEYNRLKEAAGKGRNT